MPNSIKREEIAKGVFFSSVTDKKFKINTISISFHSQLDEKTVSANAIIPGILSRSNCDYPEFTLLNNKLSALYSASLSGGCGKYGDTQFSGLVMASLDDIYAINSEKINHEATKILINCLFNPVTEDNAFPEKTFELQRQILIDDIEAELNEKRVYAVSKETELLFKGEPSRLSPNGTVELAKALNPKDTFETYKKMLRDYPVEIICCGCNDFADTKKLFTDAFSDIKRGEIEKISSTYSKCKVTPEILTEKLPVSQSKMVIGFKAAEDADDKSISLMASVFGGTTTSKLFLNVREKLSLCYYCWARYNKIKNSMLIDCGIENANIEKAKNEIMAQFEEMKKGNFTDDDINASKMSAMNDSRTVNDTTQSIISWYHRHIYMNDIITPEEAGERLQSVTREDITKAANSMKLDSIYILTTDEKAGEPNEQ